MISEPPNPNPQSRDTEAANLINAFEGVALDAEAQAEIYRTLEACAERRRALEADPEHDPERFFVGVEETNGYLGQLESGYEGDWVEYKPEGEHSWENLGPGGNAAEIDEIVAGMEARKAAMSPEEQNAEAEASRAAVRAEIAAQSVLPKPEPDPDDPRLDWRNWEAGSYAEPKAPEPKLPSPLRGEGRERGADPSPEPRKPKPQAEVRQAKARRRDSAAGHEREPGPAGQPAPKATGLTSRTMVRDGPTGSPEKPKRTYKPRTPKPHFTPPDKKRKAKAIAAVAADRREAASAEAERRRQRSKAAKLAQAAEGTPAKAGGREAGAAEAERRERKQTSDSAGR